MKYIVRYETNNYINEYHTYSKDKAMEDFNQKKEDNYKVELIEVENMIISSQNLYSFKPNGLKLTK